MSPLSLLRRALLFLPACLAPFPATPQTYIISTVAGGGLASNIPASAAELSAPVSLAIDPSGNLYFGDNAVLYRFDAKSGLVNRIAGDGTPGFSGDDGLATSAHISSASGIAFDPAGRLYIADFGNGRVRRIANGVISTVAGGGISAGTNIPATSAALSPYALAFDSTGGMYIADASRNRILRVADGLLSSVAGNGALSSQGDGGPALLASLAMPIGLAIDAAGSLLITEMLGNRVRKVQNGIITTVAGTGARGPLGDNGPATSAQFNYPGGLAISPSGDIYVADGYNSRVRRISNGAITTAAGTGIQGFAGDGGPPRLAQLAGPVAVAFDRDRNLYIADQWNHRIRKVQDDNITTLIGTTDPLDSSAAAVRLLGPRGLAVDADGNVYIAELLAGRIRKVSNGAVSFLRGISVGSLDGTSNPSSLSSFIANLLVDPKGGLYFTDERSYQVLKWSNGVVTVIAGTGRAGFSGDGDAARNANLWPPLSLALDSAGNIYIGDGGNSRVRKITNGIITTVAGTGVQGFSGDGGLATEARLTVPWGIAIDAADNLYIADSGNRRVRKVAGGLISTVAGSGGLREYGETPATGPALSLPLYPETVAVDARGDLFIVDVPFIRKVSSGILSTVAGQPTGGLSGDDGPALQARLSNSVGQIVAHPSGRIYFSDYDNNRIRVLTPDTGPIIETITPLFGLPGAIQAGAWVSIYGHNFATDSGSANVTINGRPALVTYSDFRQMNLIAPSDAFLGEVSVVVTTASGSASTKITLAPFAPAFCLLGDGRSPSGRVVPPNGAAFPFASQDLPAAWPFLGPSETFSFATTPARSGDTVVLYGTGFGSPGFSSPFGLLTPFPVAITIGGKQARVISVDLAPSGLTRFYVVVPELAPGTHSLRAEVGGFVTPEGPVIMVRSDMVR